MPRQRFPDSATPKANNRGRQVASLSGYQRPGLPMQNSSAESSRESFRDEDEEGSYQSSNSGGSEEDEIDSEFDQSDFDGIDEDDDDDEGESQSGDSEYSSQGEYPEMEGSGEEEEEGEDFDDEYSRGATSSVMEFTGMEAVEEIEKQKQAAAAANRSPPSSPPAPQRTSAKGGDDLLKQYMGVLHGGGRGEDSVSETMEHRIAKGVAKSTHERSDFILNQSMSDMSVGSRSTRQSRREAVMVAQRLNFLEDDPAEMTYTRQIALYLMKRYKWYNPRLGEPPEDIHDDESTQMGGAFRSKDGYPMLKVRPENPSLEAAWAYFEHFTLTRYVYEPKPMEDKAMLTRIWNKFQKGDKEMERAERNENILPTKLYDPIWTPHNQLGDWGIGWGLYFASLRGLMVLCFVAGLCSLPNMLFFAGKSYSGGQEGVPPILASSAICTDSDWVVCPRCAGLTRVELPYDRLGYAFNEEINLNMTFAIKTNCDGATLNTGMVHFGILLLVCLGLFLLNRYVMSTLVGQLSIGSFGAWARSF